MLRLGRKYEFKRFYEDAVSRLQAEFPITLDGWDKLDRCGRIEDVDELYFDVLNMAIELDLQAIIPAVISLCVGNAVCESYFIASSLPLIVVLMCS